mmetsp:Transcript_8066/g.24146  ORF Transcript_8066/g.24146 Transcript_8066/m.24146 type:complete len:200 (+) Transcript_8066:942-1541(+)
MVPTPSSVRISCSSEWGCLPSMMCAAWTPWAMERTQHWTLGIIPPAITSLSIRPRVVWMSSSLYRVPTSSLSSMTPGTSVIRMSFSAPRLAAISPAAMSAFTLRDCPFSSEATEAMTGMLLFSTMARMRLGSTPVTSPTKPSSLSLVCLADIMFASLPQSPTAFPPALLMRLTMLLFTLPARTASTISMVASSVTRRPL